MFEKSKIMVLRDDEAGVIAVVDGPEAAAAYLVENLWVGSRSTIWSCEKQDWIEIQNVFGIFGRQGISDEELYNFCVDMFKDVYSEVYDWDFDIYHLEHWTCK